VALGDDILSNKASGSGPATVETWGRDLAMTSDFGRAGRAAWTWVSVLGLSGSVGGSRI
jgi:hypothetical protein